jgi:glucose-6-phosphate isomerase
MSRALWDRFREHYFRDEATGLTLDISRMRFPDGFLADMEPAMQRAYDEMAALEAGAIANVDEQRMVGHYWLRDPERAPTPALAADIDATVTRIRDFAAAVHAGGVRGERAPFRRCLVVGIGGSALGPQLCAAALGSPDDRLRPAFFDNTDPDGFDLVLEELPLAETLTIVISKSGGTKETRNGMLEAADAYRRHQLDFSRHAVAVTGAGSELDKVAERDGWIARFPMWDWVGGRTSELSAVGLLPAALQGVDIDALLAGARDVDELTRRRETRKNPAALLALMWHHAGRGRGEKDMVVLPYKDRLLLFSRYLQQLVMESLGKEKDRDGKVVRQGIAVYGNKGSTDQHAYVQQLRDGLLNFFVTFLSVAEDRGAPSPLVGEGATSGDYLLGFLEGTRRALYESDRESVTLGLPRVDARALGGLIALYERTVGFYGSLVNVNAYHQPGVEAGKKAATMVLALQGKALAALREHDGGQGQGMTAEQAAQAIGAPDEVELVWKILEHAAANRDHGVHREAGATPFDARYSHG